MKQKLQLIEKALSNRGVLLRTEKSCVEIFYTAFNFVLYHNKQDILAPKCHLLEEPKTLITHLREIF